MVDQVSEKVPPTGYKIMFYMLRQNVSVERLSFWMTYLAENYTFRIPVQYYGLTSVNQDAGPRLRTGWRASK